MNNNLVKEMIDTLLKTMKSDRVFYNALIEKCNRRGLEKHSVLSTSENIQNTKNNIDLLIKYLSILKENLTS